MGDGEGLKRTPSDGPWRDEPTAAAPRGAALPIPVVVRVVTGSGQPSELRLARGHCSIGAGRDVDMVIDDKTISRRHVQLRLVPEGVAIEDLGSQNGTFYLGQRITQAVLSPGSTFRIGDATLALDVDRGSIDRTRLASVTAYGRLVGVSPAMRRLFGLLTRLQGSLVNTLIIGESGSGKELVADAIHRHSSVAAGPFVALNCGALDRTLARSELFGHRRGAFSGAVEHRTGAFEQASGGTLFLDEIAELPLDVQPLLLRALETGHVARLGEPGERQVKVRLLSATHRDLDALVAAGQFREDLLYRLGVVRLKIPPLCERLDDFELLTHHLAAEAGIEALSVEMVQELRSRPWPGNVRQLRNELLAFSALGELAECQPRVAANARQLEDSLAGFIDVGTAYAKQKEALLTTFTRLYVDTMLEHTKGNQSEAARLSGMDRSHLNKVAKASRSS